LQLISKHKKIIVGSINHCEKSHTKGNFSVCKVESDKINLTQQEIDIGNCFPTQILIKPRNWLFTNAKLLVATHLKIVEFDFKKKRLYRCAHQNK
jgi:hypothetical protein